MAMRRVILAALLACAACKGKGDAGKASTPDQRCEQLAKTCGDSDKHVEKLLDGCKQAEVPACADKLSALYDCYEKQLCGKGDRIWSFEDFGVLADRKSACATERGAASSCK
jgi:hypothetical protein